MTDAPDVWNVHAMRSVLDERTIEDAIALQLGRRPVRLSQFPTKRPRYVYEAFFDAGRSVIFKAEHETAGDDAIALECWAMERVREAGVPAPTVLALDTSGASFLGRYAIFERVRGVAVSELELSTQDRARVLGAAGELLRRVHSIGVEGYGRLSDDLFLRAGEVRGVDATWRAAALGPALAAVVYVREHALFAPDELARVDDVFRSRDDLFPEHLAARLLHGDFDATHVFVDPGTLELTGIIDFGDRSAGHPAWDLSTMALWDGMENLRLLLSGYEPDPAVRESLLARATVYLLANMLRLIHVRHAVGRAADALAVADQARRLLAWQEVSG